MNRHKLVATIFDAIEMQKSIEDVVLPLAALVDSAALKADVEVQRHPLGFVALSWALSPARVVRLHLWSREFDWAQSEELQIHDHTFAFTSAVLLGEVRNDEYRLEMDDYSGRSLFSTDYSAGQSHLKLQSRGVVPAITSSDAYKAGRFYSVSPGVLHRTTLLSEVGLTALAARYDTASKAGARVIGPDAQAELDFDRSTDGEMRVQFLSMAQALLRKAHSSRGISSGR